MLLRVSIALTFIGHGIECLLLKAVFVDYLYAVLAYLPFVSLSSDAVDMLMRVIGGLDIACGVILLFPYRMRKFVLWMAFWGIATAFVRMVFGGWGNYPECLLRLIHGGLPCCLYLLWNYSEKGKYEKI